MINPTVVEGQIAGGVVQGIGGVLYEYLPYDEDGNPLATTFVDYLLPTASEVPLIEYGHIETPAHESGWAQGHGGGRRDRITAGRDQRGRRCAGAARRAGPVAAARSGRRARVDPGRELSARRVQPVGPAIARSWTKVVQGVG